MAGRRYDGRQLALGAGLVAAAVAAGSVLAFATSRPHGAHEVASGATRTPASPPSSPSAVPSPTTASPTPSRSPSASPSRRPTAAVTISYRLASRAGAADAVLDFEVSGEVPQVFDPVTGAAIPASDVETLGTTIDYGDGSPLDGSDAGEVTCRKAAPLVPLDQTFEQRHTYAKPGTYTVTFTTAECGMPHLRRTATVRVTEPPHHLAVDLSLPQTAAVGAPVGLRVHVTGYAAGDRPLTVDYGDGSTAAAAGTTRCSGSWHAIDETIALTHAWTSAGTYTVTVADDVCGVESGARADLTVTAR